MWVKSRVEFNFTILNFIYHCEYVWERSACGNMCHRIHMEVQGQPEESALSFALYVNSRDCTASLITCWSMLTALWCLFLTLPSSIRWLVMWIPGSIWVVCVLFLLLFLKYNQLELRLWCLQYFSFCLWLLWLLWVFCLSPYEFYDFFLILWDIIGILVGIWLNLWRIDASYCPHQVYSEDSFFDDLSELYFLVSFSEKSYLWTEKLFI